MVQYVFNELQQRVIKSLLVQLTGSAPLLFNVSVSIVRVDMSLEAPSHLTSPWQQMLH